MSIPDNNTSNSNFNGLIDLNSFLDQEGLSRCFPSDTTHSTLKKIEIESNVSFNKTPDLFLKNAITKFWERNKGKRVEKILPKMALVASTVEELNTFLRPAVEKVIDDMHLSTIKVLGIPGKSGNTSNEELIEFENLDTPGSEKQFVLLTNEVKKIWTCRSLFGIALPYRIEFADLLLQQLAYCLHPLGEDHQVCQAFLSDENAETLISTLKKDFNLNG